MRVAFATLGCKVNQYDTATIETSLTRDGCEVVPFNSAADVYVLNTCTVTDRADAESRQLARRARRVSPDARIIVTGCFAQTSPAVVSAMPEVDHVVGIGRLPDILRAVRGELTDRIVVENLRRAERVATIGAEVFTGQTRAFLKVQEGCDLFCTFCIVPFARGRSRSVPPRAIVRELERLAAAGFQEVVLTGIHLGGYGEDLTPRLTLVDLVEMLAELRPVPRIRLSSIDPPEITTRLLESIARSDVLCPHLHVPVQAACDRTLRRMRRRYDVALLTDVFAEIRRVLPDAGIGTDVIAGFPGESDADFAASTAVLAASPLTYFHVFPYSRRTGTTAAKFTDTVAADVLSARARTLRRLGASQRRAFVERWLGRPQRVLLETARDRETGLLVGYSRHYVRVLIAGGDQWMNREVEVTAHARRGDRALACALRSLEGNRDGRRE
jgi:threonylcarbamoyladenosine tRNA methylthiotransferase MtaB